MPSQPLPQSASAGAPLLDAQDITVRFGGLVAVDSVSARFTSGELVGIIGPNGAGKTTFFNAISGVQVPTAGTLVLEGRSLAGQRPHRFAALGLARTFQTPRVFADMVVLSNIEFGLKFAGRAKLVIKPKGYQVHPAQIENHFCLLSDQVATLAWLAQTAALEIHVPQWRVDGRRSANPDRIVIDLDPGPGAGLPECVVVATAARSLLEDLGLHPVPVTSGSKGIHLYAGLPGTVTSDEVSAVAHELARTLASQLPELVVVDMATALRRGKVLVDWSQNNAAKTTVCPYSLRGRARPTVAAPRTWRELGSPTVRQLELSEVLRRVRRRGDPLADLGVDGPSAP